MMLIFRNLEISRFFLFLLGAAVKRSWAAFGIILLILGYALIIWGAGFKVKIVIESRIAGSEIDSFEVSGNFSAGSRLVLDLAPGKEWWIWFEPSSGLSNWPLQQDAALVEITIIDPHKGKTNITLYFVKVQTAAEPRGQFFGGVVESNGGGLEMEEEYIIAEKNGTKYYNYKDNNYKNKFSAITKFNGNYTAVITNQYEGYFIGPPSKFTMIEEKLREERPYFYLIPVGGVAFTSGIILIMSTRSKKPKRAKWKRRKE